jgi:hypothetical protein
MDGTQESDMPISTAHHATDDAGGRYSQDVSFTIVDDPSNAIVFKGAGNYAATRGESVIRVVEKAFPGLRFSQSHDRLLSFLSVKASIDFPVQEEAFVAILAGALTASGTRLANPSIATLGA